MHDDRCSTPFGTFALSRLPIDRSGTLRAWDGADMLLLDAAAAAEIDRSTSVLVVGDNFGALTVALSSATIWVLSDSIVSDHAIQANIKANRPAGTPHHRYQAGQFLSLNLTGQELRERVGGTIDLVVWNIGKSTDEAEHIASLLPFVSDESTVVFAAGMDKHLPPKTGDILRRHGRVTTHPGRKKAHLFELRVLEGANCLVAVDRPQPPAVHIPEHGLDVVGLPGVFSAERFDLGTRLLAEFAADLDRILPEAESVVDLGCGTGILGMLALRTLPQAEVTFLDQSAAAVESARLNVTSNISTLGPKAADRAHFIRSHILKDHPMRDVDLVLCNPPFHHSNAMNDEVAWQMFHQTRQALRPGGELWVVANRHLGYHEKLTRIFSATAIMGSHPKFVVIAARR